MTKRLLLGSGLAAATVFAVVAAAWILSLPPAPADEVPAEISWQERAATIAALKSRKRRRPLVAIIGINDATETTDYLMPYGILKRADVADVVALATEPGPVSLYPALKVISDGTISEFDARHSAGADYVIVPAMRRDDDPATLRWIRSQAGKGAMIIGICAGAKVVAAAGLLDGKRATTHWYYLAEMLKRHPSIRYVPDRRFVVDEGIATTTGISASMPMMVTLVEAIGGRDKAAALAQDLGLDHWDARHSSDAFRVSRPFVGTIVGNVLAFWNREELGIELEPGIDEVALALAADAWSRTYRSRAVSFAPTAEAVQSRSGIRIIPDQISTAWDGNRVEAETGDRKPMASLRQTLHDIEARFGEPTAGVVAMQLEYQRPAGARPRREAS